MSAKRSSHDRDEERRRQKKEQKQGKGRSHAGEYALIALVVIIALAVAYWIVTTPPAPTPASGSVTDFTLPEVGASGLTGRQISLSQFYGKVIVLEFMVPWCPHCQNMAPVVEQLYGQYGPQNVVFLSVSGSWSGASAADAAGFIRQYGSQWTYVYDSSGAVFSQYGVSSTPTIFIISKGRTIANTVTGEVALDVLAADIDTAVQAP